MTPRSTRSALAALAVAGLLLTGGCLDPFGPTRPPSDERALNAVDRSRDALDDVSSYRTTVDGRLTATAGDDNDTADVAGSVAVDVSARRMNATSRVRGRLTGSTVRRTFVTGDTVYTECSRMGWSRRNRSAETPWVSYTPAGQQLALLERSNVYWRGVERVGDTEAAVVVAHPTAREFESVPGGRRTATAVFGGATVDNATVTVWLDTDSWRPVKAERTVTVSGRGTMAAASVTFRFTDYDDPVAVTRPSFDEDAVWQLGCPGDS